MAKVRESARDILSHFAEPRECDIACRLCGVRVLDDDPAAMWQGFDGLGPGVRIDEHERCDAIYSAMEARGFHEKLSSFFNSLGVAEADHERARRVLIAKLGHLWPGGDPDARPRPAKR
jgi:hypothetical protein